MNWLQALPLEIAEFVGLPCAVNQDAVLVAEDGKEIVRRGERHYLYEGTIQVRGVNAKSADLVIEATQVLQEMAAHAKTSRQTGVAHNMASTNFPLWVVFECNTSQDAEFWRQTILSRGFEKHAGGHQIIEHIVLRKGPFILAQIHGRANSRLLQKGSPNSLYNTRINYANPRWVPEGEATFPVEGTPEQLESPEFLKKAVTQAKTKAQNFFVSVAKAAGITSGRGGNHFLETDEIDKIRIQAGFDVSGFKRIGTALDDPLFLAGIDHHGNIRSRMRRILKKGTEITTDIHVGGFVAGNKTAANIRDIYHTLIQDFDTDAPKHFDVLAHAVQAVAHEHPKLPPHEVASLKTWHNNVSGVLGGATNATQGRLTAKWVVILSIVAAHQIDLTPTYTGITSEHLFFWIVYGSPIRLGKAASTQGAKLNLAEIPYYPRLAYDDGHLRKQIYDVLTSAAGNPRAGDDWEENFMQRMKHDLLVTRQAPAK